MQEWFIPKSEFILYAGVIFMQNWILFIRRSDLYTKMNFFLCRSNLYQGVNLFIRRSEFLCTGVIYIQEWNSLYAGVNLFFYIYIHRTYLYACEFFWLEWFLLYTGVIYTQEWIFFICRTDYTQEWIYVIYLWFIPNSDLYIGMIYTQEWFMHWSEFSFT